MTATQSLRARSPLFSRGVSAGKRIFVWRLMAGVLGSVSLFSAASCSSESTTKTCVPGEVNSCLGAGRCNGEQQCAEDGQSFGECSCDGTAGGGATSGAGGGAGMSMSGSGGSTMGNEMQEAAPATRFVGAPCVVDNDCEANMECLGENSAGTFGEGVPANGYCTVRCASDPSVCSEIDGASICLPQGEDSYCAAACLAGNATGALKCVGAEGSRSQACVASPADSDFPALCLPRCFNNEECTGSQVCDLGGSGLCVDTAPAGGPVGSACSVDTEEADCASGVCLALNSGATFCGGLCAFAGLNGCGFSAEEAEGERGATCLVPVQVGGGAGDIGYCRELCDVPGDCLQAGSECELANDDLAEALGRAGVCFPPAPGTVVPDAGVTPPDAGVIPPDASVTPPDAG